MTSTDETAAKPTLKQLRDQLDALVPYPGEGASVEAHIRYLASEAVIQFERYRQSMQQARAADGVPDVMIVPAITGNFAAAWFLKALNDADPAAAAKYAANVRGICEDGNTDEMTWELLRPVSDAAWDVARQIAQAMPVQPAPASPALALAKAALSRLALNDEMAGMGQRDDDPEAIARCRYAAGALESIREAEAL